MNIFSNIISSRSCLLLFGALAETALWLLPEGLPCAFGAKANVPFAGWHKIVFKKCGWEKNKKHWVGNECRFTRCPFIISFLCLWSPVKMVYFFLFLSLVCLSCRCPNTLAANGPRLCAARVL